MKSKIIIFKISVNTFRFDALNNLLLKNYSINGVINTGFLGNDKMAGNYLRSHDAAKRDGYFGTDTTGINISYCSDVKISKCKLNKIISKDGNAIGINVIFKSDVSIDKSTIEDIKAGTLDKNRKWVGKDCYGNDVKYSNTMPNKIPTSIGIRIEKDCVVDIEKVHIHDLKSPATPIKVLRE